MPWGYLQREARAALRPHQLVVLLGALLGSVGLSYFLPMLPEPVYRFFRKVFAMRSWTEIILVNDFMGVFFALYWTGVVALLRVYVVPREEGYLGLLLAKPLGRTQYLLARSLPVFGVVAFIGVVLSLFLPLKIALINGRGDLHAGSVLSAGLLATGFTLTVLALLNLVFLFTSEVYYAVLVSFIAFSAAVFPGAVFMYRPDVFAGRETLRDLIAFPANLLWRGEALPGLLPLLLPAAAALCALLFVLTGRRMAARDVP